MSTDLCPKHNLAIAPDGKCVLCRRTLAGMALEAESEGWVSQLFTWMLLLCLLGTMGGLIYVANNPAEHRGGRYVDAPPVGNLDAQRSPSAQTNGVPEPAAAPAQPEAVPEPAPLPTQTASTAAADEGASDLTGDALRLPPQAPSIPEADLSRARSKVEVTMYSAPWCYFCDRSRDFLKARDVILVEYDIEMSGEAMDALSDVNPMGTIPTFEISGETFIGFHPWVLEDAINAAALERYAAR